MSLQTIATLYNEVGPQFRIDTATHPRHVFDAETALWRSLNAERARRGEVLWTITETVETMEEAA